MHQIESAAQRMLRDLREQMSRRCQPGKRLPRPLTRVSSASSDRRLRSSRARPVDLCTDGESPISGLQTLHPEHRAQRRAMPRAQYGRSATLPRRLKHRLYDGLKHRRRARGRLRSTTSRISTIETWRRQRRNARARRSCDRTLPLALQEPGEPVRDQDASIRVRSVASDGTNICSHEARTEHRARRLGGGICTPGSQDRKPGASLLARRPPRAVALSIGGRRVAPPGTLLTPWPRLSRSSSWPPARALGCGRTLRRCFIGLRASRSSSGWSMPPGRPGRSGWSRSSGRVTGSPRGFRTVSRSPSRSRGRAPAPPCSRRGSRARRGWRAAVVVLSGDQPLITAEQLQGLLAEHEDRGRVATLLTTDQLDPAGYGRIVRDCDGTVDRIFETKHTDGLSPEELAVREVNLGTYVFDAQRPLRRPRQGRAGARRALSHRRVPADPRGRRDHRRAHDRRRRRRHRRERPRRPHGRRGGRPAPHDRGARARGCDLPSPGHHQGGGRGDDRPRHRDRAGHGPRGGHDRRRALRASARTPPPATPRSATARP